MSVRGREDRFAALQLFVRVVDLGSFTGAAREFGVGQPAVSKRVAALEARLGTQLLNRTSRGLVATAAGSDLYDAAVRLLGELDEVEGRVSRDTLGPSGAVHVATPPALGQMYIIPRLPAFFARYPGLRVELSVSADRADLVREGIDVAIRVGALDDSTLTARRIGSMPTSTVAAPGYLARRGTPGEPSDLRAHSLVMGRFGGAVVDWQFRVDGRPVAVTPSGNVGSNDAEDLRAAVLAGLGIGQSASALFQPDLRAGRLVAVLEDFAPAPLPVHAVCASGRRTPGRVRAFIDFLAEVFSAEPSLRSA